MNFHLNILGHLIFTILLLFLILKPIYSMHAALMKNFKKVSLPDSTKAAVMIVSMKFIYIAREYILNESNKSYFLVKNYKCLLPR